jgi:hypothetical protein
MSNTVVQWTGVEETLKAFRNIENFTYKENKIRLLEKRVLRRYYVPRYQRLIAATFKGSSSKIKDSIGIISSRKKFGKGKWISEKAGPRVKGRFRANRRENNSYESGGWLLNFYEWGTKERKTKKGGRRGHVKEKNIQERAFRASKAQMEREFGNGLIKMMNSAIRSKAKGKLR